MSAGRLLWHLGALLVGAAVALASVAVHRSVVLGSVPLDPPMGLLLALATSFCVPWALRQSAPRLASSYALGWLVLFGVVVAGRPEGDFAIAGDLPGYALMGAGFLLVIVAGLSFGSPRKPPRKPPGGPDKPGSREPSAPPLSMSG